MTADSGSDADEQNNQSTFDAQRDAKRPDRKVAKTLLDGQIPQLDEAPESPTSIENEVTRKPKRVAKTMLEINRPTPEQIVAASAEQENQSEHSGRKVPKTMMEISRPETKKVSKTMMEITLPAASETAKQVKKVSRTMLDVNSLDAIGMAKALKNERTSMPVKVRKTLTQDQALPDFSDLNLALNAANSAGDAKTVISASNQDLSSTVKTGDSLNQAKKRTRGTERFVAKTMMDHSVLTEQVVRLHEKEKMKAAYIAQERANEPVKEFIEVDTKKMASPCSWSWNETGGKKGRVRACDRCQTQVYDFSGMEMPEAEALIYKQESKKKFALFKRADGKFMTTDCPVQVQRKRNLVLLCVIGAVVMISAVALMVLMPPPPKEAAPAVVPATTGDATTGNSRPSTSTFTPSSTTPSLTSGKSEANMRQEEEARRAAQQKSGGSEFFPSVIGVPQQPSSQSLTPQEPLSQYSETKAKRSDSSTKSQKNDEQDSKYWDSDK